MSKRISSGFLAFAAIVLLGLSLPIEAGAQHAAMTSVKMDTTIYKLTRMTIDDYVNIEIPSLAELFENARAAASVKYYEYEAEYLAGNIKLERRKPLEWIRIIGSCTYGNIDMAAIAMMESTYQVWTQNQTSQSTNYYNVGLTLSIPLADIFNTGTKVKQAKAKYNGMRAKQEAELEEIKEEIVDLYCTIEEKIQTLQSLSELLVISRAQYDLTELSFANDKTDFHQLYLSQGYASNAVKDFEEVRKDLNAALLTLELVSCTPIVSNYVLPDKEEE